MGRRALDLDAGPWGEWKTFSAGAVRNAQGGTDYLKLAGAPVRTQYLRILMTESSNTCDLQGPDDVRNCVGYAIQEIPVGSVDCGLAGTELAKAQCNTVPLKLLKIAAQIRITVRKIWVSRSTGYPYLEFFRQEHRNLEVTEREGLARPIGQHAKSLGVVGVARTENRNSRGGDGEQGRRGRSVG